MIKSKLLDRIKVIKSRAEGTGTSNRSTKNFFNFTYKKYRFYFGIYTPCNHYYDPNLPAPNNSWLPKDIHTGEDNEIELFDFLQRRKQCSVPSPFVMSQDRRACVMHQRNNKISQIILVQPNLKRNQIKPQRARDAFKNGEIKLSHQSTLRV
jgi:hypothetical protein